MKIEGGCYCGQLRYKTEGEPVMKAQCLCRECQYISGGGPNFFMMMPQEGFSYTKGEPRKFTRSDIEGARTRDFCPNCGTPVTTLLPGGPLAVIKVGTLDKPEKYGGPSMAKFALDKQPFHCIAEGLPVFERIPQK